MRDQRIAPRDPMPEMQRITNLFHIRRQRKQYVGNPERCQQSRHRQQRSRHYAYEHHSVGRACASLKNSGIAVYTLPVSEEGKIDLPALLRALERQPRLVTIQYANNEVGTIRDIPTISTLCQKKVYCSMQMLYRQSGISPQYQTASIFSVLPRINLAAPKAQASCMHEILLC